MLIADDRKHDEPIHIHQCCKKGKQIDINFDFDWSFMSRYIHAQIYQSSRFEWKSWSIGVVLIYKIKYIYAIQKAINNTIGKKRKKSE